MNKRHLALSIVALCTLAACGRTPAETPDRSDQSNGEITQGKTDTDIPAYRLRRPEDEVVYFMLPDRFSDGDPTNNTGGLEGGPLLTGYDPTHKGFYQGGDLKGLTNKLDYIQGMGITAIWLGPIYKNKPVQGPPGAESAGYHGYWITDFTTVDPHLGTEEDLKTFIDEAHRRGIKIYLDIITNHTADVIHYRECHDPDFSGEKIGPACPYRSLADYPYSTQGDIHGRSINASFAGDDAAHQTRDNFAKLDNLNYAYTPYIPGGEESVKVPDWLNDLKYYHNRGETTFRGEDSRYGDFAGLDDLFTERPDVVQGFIEIYSDWITKYKIDGFRIDTARHVNPEFWQQFLPAVIDHAHQQGIPNFYVFGEVYDPDPGALARFTRVDEFPAVLDFAFQSAIQAIVAGNAPPATFVPLFRADALYEDGETRANQLPTFLGNHDMGRLAHAILNQNPTLSEEDVLRRLELANALLIFSRGVPVIYSGDEQGFVGDGGDQDAREPLFPSQVASYADNNLIGTEKSSADDNFDTDHPLYRNIRDLAKTYGDHPALRHGAMTVRTASLEGPGAFAFSRHDPAEGREYLIAANTSSEPITYNTTVDHSSQLWESLLGECAPKSVAPGTFTVTLPPYGYMVCRSKD